jgi:hypothetical protein
VRPRATAAAVAAAVATVTAVGCADVESTMPRCDASTTLGIIAQSAPAAAYVPCIDELPTGWSYVGTEVGHDGTTISLESDRADRRVDIVLTDSCDIDRATPTAPSDAGMRTYQRIDAVDPRYAGSFIDVFPGGCIIANYDFERGPHVVLVTQLQEAVDVVSRRQLRHELLHELDVRLDP